MNLQPASSPGGSLPYLARWRVGMVLLAALLLALPLFGQAPIAQAQPAGPALCQATPEMLTRAANGNPLAVLAQLARACGDRTVADQIPLPADPAIDTDGGGVWPAGVNDESCKSRPGGPAPVLLIPGMGVPGEILYWVRLAPGLQASGHCVFAMELPGLATVSPTLGAAAIRQKLARIRQSTGDPKPAVVTYSVGAVYAREAIREGETAISDLVTLAGQNNGFSPVISLLITLPILHQLAGMVCPMCYDMVHGSPYLQQLAAANTANVVPTTTLSSRLDWASVPEDNFLPGATNLVLQDLCPTDWAGHLTGEWSAEALVVVEAALNTPGPAPQWPTQPPFCGLGFPL